MGFALGHLPRERHPSYAASTCCRFGTLTLRVHGYLQASHNHVERQLRDVVLGRKNHYGSKSQRGTEVAALFYSLIETAKLCGEDPGDYLLRAALAAIEKPGTITFRSPHRARRTVSLYRLCCESFHS
ncbi:hypothetical protein POL68_06550 [Stigmatella sp. ncwal1]|uniref:Transposase n=1 Tax=Stigmatella ashevillensis TaxID=2995309 RepID=A0ABT5D391_9BACT|nr:hypothetical protein [Stigmatella ashevillena]MDC0708124.1 hypothetical protein [Stigmatella ashevillena]